MGILFGLQERDLAIKPDYDYNTVHMAESIRFLNRPTIENHPGYKKCVELRELQYISLDVDIPIIVQTPFLNELPKEHIHGAHKKIVAADMLLPDIRKILVHDINNLVFIADKKKDMESIIDAVIADQAPKDLFKYFIRVFERYIDFGDLIPDRHTISPQEFLISMMHACGELSARLHQASGDTHLKKMAKTIFLHCTAMEFLLAGVKTNSYISAMEEEGCDPDTLKDIAPIIFFQNDEEFNRAITAALLNDWGVGPVKTNRAGKFINLGKA